MACQQRLVGRNDMLFAAQCAFDQRPRGTLFAADKFNNNIDIFALCEFECIRREWNSG
jgi:hypothetical protein